MTVYSANSAEFFLAGGAESLLRVRSVNLGDRSSRLEVKTGHWLTDPVVGLCRGALGVPLDGATGVTVAATLPETSWPVSLSIRADYVADPPLDGSTLTFVGELVETGERTATSRGTATDHAGHTIAIVTQRSHLLAVDGHPRMPEAALDLRTPDVPIRDALGIEDVATGVVELRDRTFANNPMGNIHGGILICGMEFAAMSALGARGELRTTSVDITYVRPASGTGATTFRADIVHRGRSFGVVSVTAYNDTGKAAALGTVIVSPNDDVRICPGGSA